VWWPLNDIAQFFRDTMKDDSARAARAHDLLKNISGTDQAGPAAQWALRQPGSAGPCLVPSEHGAPLPADSRLRVLAGLLVTWIVLGLAAIGGALALIIR
jgi:hypothetical protein